MTFDTPQPIISFKVYSDPTWPNGPAWECLTDPTTHYVLFSFFQIMAYDEKMGYQAEKNIHVVPLPTGFRPTAQPINRPRHDPTKMTP